MKKSLLLFFLAAFALLPTLSEAGPICISGSPNGFFRLDIKPSCKASNAKISAVTGRWQPGFSCNGGTTWGVHGTCLGIPSTGEVHINLTSELSDPSDSCIPVMWSLRGPTVDSVAGTFDNAPFGSVNGSFAFSAAPCSSEPTPALLSGPLVGPAAGLP